MTSKRLLDISIKFYTSPKNLYPPKQISGYAPAPQILFTPSTVHEIGLQIMKIFAIVLPFNLTVMLYILYKAFLCNLQTTVT